MTDRHKLTFEQAEGAAPLPTQLLPKTVSPQLRALLWALVYRSLRDDKMASHGRVYVDQIGYNWESVLLDLHINKHHRMIDEFNLDFEYQAHNIRQIIVGANYIGLFGWIQSVLRHPDCPADFSEGVDGALTESLASYRVVNRDTIIPVASEFDRNTIEIGLEELRKADFNGAYQHLRSSANDLGSGRFADSVRNSIHAVEAVARVLSSSDKLSDALANLEKTTKIHVAMRRGFGSLYGWTSDEQGIRHPLLDEGDANVDEADALFMLGACAAFVSHLLAKGRKVGLL